MNFSNDQRVIMTLDAGGTNFRFSAMRGGVAVTDTVAMPSNGDNLQKSLSNILDGFAQVRAKCPTPPAAISFAFPGPVDYPNGIIGDLGNLPGYRGGVALGPMLTNHFKIPTYINNDGDLFTYGEAIAGFLPHINELLEKAGSPKRYRNLFGITLGTGLGGGIVRNGDLFIGDNSGAGELWLLRNKKHPQMNAEEGACIRAVRRVYAEISGIPLDQAPDPYGISRIASGELEGNREAAQEAYRSLGEIAGDAIGNALNLVDGLVVIGGGVSKAWMHFLPALLKEVNGNYIGPAGNSFRRLGPHVFNAEDPVDLDAFLIGGIREVSVPGTSQTIRHDPMPRIAVGVSRLGTSEAVSIGACAFALKALDSKE